MRFFFDPLSEPFSLKHRGLMQLLKAVYLVRVYVSPCIRDGLAQKLVAQVHGFVIACMFQSETRTDNIIDAVEI